MATVRMKMQVVTLPVTWIAGIGVLCFAFPSWALTFNLTYDASTVGAPAGFFTAFQAAISFYQSAYSDPITINLQVGWGKINGQNLSPGNLGQSSTFQRGNLNYDQIVTALVNDATSADDATAVASLPAVDPTGSATFVMANAEAKALGLMPANATGIDGYVGFSSTAAYTFDTTNRSSPVSGFVVQTNADLTSANWRPANYAISTANGTNYSTTIDLLPAGNLFFRLLHP